MSQKPFDVVPILVLIFVGWRLVVRCRRNVGRQPFRPRRMVFRICIYAVFTLLLAVAVTVVAPRPTILTSLFGGVGLGAALGVYGLHLTRFESSAQGRFYLPNPYMGVGVSMLLVARLAYRLLGLTGAIERQGSQLKILQSPLTMFLFGLVAGYYIAYFTGVLLHSPEKDPPAV